MKYSLWFLIGIVVIAFGFGYGVSVWRDRQLTVRLAALERENETLRQEALIVKGMPERFSDRGFQGLKAKTFSIYAFNNRSLIAASAGSIDGVMIGMPVMLSGDILVGRVVEVHKYYSVIQTLHDSEWSLAVRLGENYTEGLMAGGPEPQIDLISKESQLEIGDAVLAASPDVPFGLIVGKIQALQDDPAEAFLTAQVRLETKAGQLREVFIITNF
jgi:cell shape-determining protein MreC